MNYSTIKGFFIAKKKNLQVRHSAERDNFFF